MGNKGVIYILTNPSFKEYVKIGYADNVDSRLKQLNNSGFVYLLRGSVGKLAIFKQDNSHKTGFICAQMVIVRSY